MTKNPYQSPSVGYGEMVAHADTDARATFIRRTYLHLLGALLAFVAIDTIILTLFGDQLEPLVRSMTGGWSWLIVLGAFMGVSYIANTWAHSRTSRSMQYMGLGLYVVAEAIIFIPLLYMAQKYDPSGALIRQSGVVTAIAFGGLTAVVFLTKTDFSFLYWGLVAFGFVAIGLIIASIVVGFSMGILFSGVMVVFASGMILYNTSNIMLHYDTESYVAAALGLFASVALMLWYVIQIFMYADD